LVQKKVVISPYREGASTKIERAGEQEK
jgi:hypothetical protein